MSSKRAVKVSKATGATKRVETTSLPAKDGRTSMEESGQPDDDAYDLKERGAVDEQADWRIWSSKPPIHFNTFDGGPVFPLEGLTMTRARRTHMMDVPRMQTANKGSVIGDSMEQVTDTGSAFL